MQGKCREAQDTISRLIFIITNLDGNDFGKKTFLKNFTDFFPFFSTVMFMEENIVGFTLIFTLILWIPSAILIHFCVSFQDSSLWCPVISVS